MIVKVYNTRYGWKVAFKGEGKYQPFKWVIPLDWDNMKLVKTK